MCLSIGLRRGTIVEHSTKNQQIKLGKSVNFFSKIVAPHEIFSKIFKIFYFFCQSKLIPWNIVEQLMLYIRCMSPCRSRMNYNDQYILRKLKELSEKIVIRNGEIKKSCIFRLEMDEYE